MIDLPKINKTRHESKKRCNKLKGKILDIIDEQTYTIAEINSVMIGILKENIDQELRANLGDLVEY